MHYFSHLSWSYACTNNLQKAVLEFLQKRSRMVIDAKNISQFKEEILFGIANLGLQHSKCRPIQAYWTSSEDSTLDMGSGIIGRFNLYKSKN